MNKKMVEAAKRALQAVLQVEPGQRYLVITDQEKKSIGEAFKAAGEELKLKTSIYFLPEDRRPLKDIPSDLEKLLTELDVATTLFKGIPEETPFRIKLIKRILQVAKRLGHAPGITEDMMLKGPMNIDYQDMVKTAEKLMQALQNAREVHITSPAGTDIRLNIEGRAWETDVVIPEGNFGNLPCGEIWCAPVEDGANGTLVCDGSIGDFGMVPAPLKITVKDGKITSWECPDRAFGEKVYEALTLDSQSDVVGELGIGINPGARITGNLLEDEKAFRTIHIAFGNNENMPGGQNQSQTHRDFLVKNPDLVVTYQDGSRRQLLKEGIIQI